MFVQFSLAIEMCREYDAVEDHGFRLLWYAMLALVVPSAPFRKRVNQQMFLPSDLILFKCAAGVAVCTRLDACVNDTQVNVNIVVPSSPNRVPELVSRACKFLDEKIRGCCINLEPVATHAAHALTGRRRISNARFVSHRKQIGDISLDQCRGVLMHQGREQPVMHWLASIDGVAPYRPLSAMKEDDDDDVVYWMRTPCKRLVAFKNPRRVLHAGGDLPDPMHDGERISGEVDEQNADVVCALLSNSMQSYLDVIHMSEVPKGIRAFFAQVAVHNIGICDELIQSVTRLCICNVDKIHQPDFVITFAIEVSNTLRDLCYVGLIMMLLSGVRPLDTVRIPAYHVNAKMECSNTSEASYVVQDTNINLQTVLSNVHVKYAWRQWAVESAFIFAYLAVVSLEGAASLCKTFDYMCEAMKCMLLASMGAWTTLQVQKADMLIKMNGACNEIVMEVNRLHQEALNNGKEVVNEEIQVHDGVPPQRSPRADGKLVRSKRRRKPKAVRRGEEIKGGDALVPSELHPASTDTATTHGALVSRLAKTYDLECELIGSGVFFTSSDADIVITIDADTLDGAYEMVVAKTGWVRAYDTLGERVAVLHGVFEGVAIDAQVRRPASRLLTPAEHRTEAAVGLAHCMQMQSDHVRRTLVKALHEWVTLAGLKGHQFCRLPGVAITCIAILLSSHLRDTAKDDAYRILEALRGCLTHTAPHMHFSNQSVVPADGQRPTTGLVVTVNGEVNLASRMTSATTRHLLDSLAYGISKPKAFMSSATYSQWRDATMITCLRFRAIKAAERDRAIASTLHVSAKQFDAHPLVDALYLEEKDDLIIVRVTLRAGADASRYGFRDDDRVEIEQGDVVRVTRRGRSWTMLGTTRPASVASWPERCTVCDILEVPGSADVRVPNAPHLSADAAVCFVQKRPGVWAVA